MEYKDPGRYIPIIYLLYSWGSLFGVPSRVPFNAAWQECAVSLERHQYNAACAKSGSRV